MNNTIKTIKQQIKTHPILLYMKGTPNIFKCGFSSKASQILSEYIKSFVYIDVLVHTDIRSALPSFSNWPTFPQLWVEGKLIGGFDILSDMHQDGSLKKLIDPIKIKYNLD
ncbi:glutaredoxin-4 [Candidatus Blochmanniella vafra str. BVAF]|uniref:Glutaredoxin n=1 Tax=Blochmanniella vafra (strain BVAF) TaxID=859654 RepID=E8Q669_BLOVB|nr:Grx4 family monothiol glutaredoxin [Candidatus Blochmannia vafer]ADV33763.1 glutaredoxin-4 [Candidatus Blochmannia vafer str. BVAF]